MQKNNIFYQFDFCRILFLIALYQILQNDAILTNHKSLLQEKESSQFHRSQFHRSQFLGIKSLMAETIKNQTISNTEE